MVPDNYLKGEPRDEQARRIPRGYSLIGDIAVFSLPPALHDMRMEVAEAIRIRHGNLHTVVYREPIPRGELRVAETEVLVGSETETVCREHGFFYRLDVCRTFYNPRLASERRRVWMQVGASEEVLVPFAGVGPFVIPAASRGANVTAVEKNPVSCRFLMGNASRNRVGSRVTVIQGDIKRILPGLTPGFDRAIVPAPYGLDQSLFMILPLVRQGGVIHFYTFKRASQVPALIREYEQAGLSVRVARRCGNVAPGVARYVFDMVRMSGKNRS